MSPSLSEGIGMGYLDRAYCTLGTKIFVRIRDKQIPAEIVKLPFYKA
jgi:aminomethyltransferase